MVLVADCLVCRMYALNHIGQLVIVDVIFVASCFALAAVGVALALAGGWGRFLVWQTCRGAGRPAYGLVGGLLVWVVLSFWYSCAMCILVELLLQASAAVVAGWLLFEAVWWDFSRALGLAREG